MTYSNRKEGGGKGYFHVLCQQTGPALCLEGRGLVCQSQQIVASSEMVLSLSALAGRNDIPMGWVHGMKGSGPLGIYVFIAVGGRGIWTMISELCVSLCAVVFCDVSRRGQGYDHSRRCRYTRGKYMRGEHHEGLQTKSIPSPKLQKSDRIQTRSHQRRKL